MSRLPFGIGDFVMQLKEATFKGDIPGHEFHGNQYDAGGGSSSPSVSSGSTTDTYEKLATPQKRASEIIKETNYPEITQGTDKQIKYAQDLRSNFIANTTASEADANVRWAVIKQTQRHEPLSDSDIRYLANDAWNRRTAVAINTADAKKIIDHFSSPIGQQREIDAKGRYQNIIKYPKNWAYDAKKGWQRK